jgi:replication-associated recombination protein RarA
VLTIYLSHKATPDVVPLLVHHPQSDRFEIVTLAKAIRASSQNASLFWAKLFLLGGET